MRVTWMQVRILLGAWWNAEEEWRRRGDSELAFFVSPPLLFSLSPLLDAAAVVAQLAEAAVLRIARVRVRLPPAAKRIEATEKTEKPP